MTDEKPTGRIECPVALVGHLAPLGALAAEFKVPFPKVPFELFYLRQAHVGGGWQKVMKSST